MLSHVLQTPLNHVFWKKSSLLSVSTVSIFLKAAFKHRTTILLSWSQRSPSQSVPLMATVACFCLFAWSGVGEVSKRLFGFWTFWFVGSEATLQCTTWLHNKSNHIIEIDALITPKKIFVTILSALLLSCCFSVEHKGVAFCCMRTNDLCVITAASWVRPSERNATISWYPNRTLQNKDHPEGWFKFKDQADAHV